MKRLGILVFLLAASLAARGQSYGRFQPDFSLQNAQGQAIAGASVCIYSQPASGTSHQTLTACGPGTAIVYGSSTGSGAAVCGSTSASLAQPLFTDGFGHACAYASSASYTVCYNSAFTGLLCYPNQQVYLPNTGSFLPLGGGTLTGTLKGTSANFPDAGTFTGTVTGHSTLDLESANDLSDIPSPSTALNHLCPPPGCAFANPVSVPYLNGIPMADQFAGANFCVKLRAANVAALAAGIHLVDATRFTGTQACTVDPWNTLGTAYTVINLTDLMPAAHIQATVPIVVNNSGVVIQGQGPYATQWEYTGSSTPEGFSFEGSARDPLQAIQLSNIFVYGDSGNLTDCVYVYNTHRSDLRNVYTWGCTNGIHENAAVTDTLYRPKTSNEDATAIGILNSSHTTPTHGLYLTSSGGVDTTDGTVIDPAAEGLSGTGWWLNEASSMTFTSGTSEDNTAGSGNPGAVQIDSSSLHNTFIGGDFEGNTGYDVLDNGTDNQFQKVICTDGFTAGSSSQYSTVDSATCSFRAQSGARFAMHKIGPVVAWSSANSAAFNGGGINWNRLSQGETDIDSYVTRGPCAIAFNAFGSKSFTNVGCFNANGTILAPGESSFAGQAACYTTGGRMGHCTSAVGSTGACTCTAP